MVILMTATTTMKTRGSSFLGTYRIFKFSLLVHIYDERLDFIGFNINQSQWQGPLWGPRDG